MFKRRSQLLGGWDCAPSSIDREAWCPEWVRNFPLYQKVQPGSRAHKTSWSMDTSLSTKDGFFYKLPVRIRKKVCNQKPHQILSIYSVIWFKINVFSFQITRVIEESSLMRHTQWTKTISCKIESQPANNGTLHTQRVEGMLQYSVLWSYW
jgi:hypothetical protein